ncbi:TetR/AcrR family transcriptional regulator [Actinoplanes aureus]|uniref:Helix-turn-helix transcriptional regulator n=1 Tax=Actinoplanes aureus TaxID=2792083 RepID=A0A931C8Q6_9ACTN|nr:TetR/AcrR family transcriptional regulator [Actinoplanes aureus]MBG0561543.1 helix-turn-helix transcriptional regulator [Actinoplanes aureus]
MLPPASESLLGRALAEAFELADLDEEPAGDNDEVTTRLLDAAYDQFCRIGIRRSTMGDVARRAGVSRITAYRRFATKDALVEQVVRREFRRYFDRFLVDIQQARTAADRVVLGFVSSLQAIRSNPLIGGLMDIEPDLLVPSLIGNGGRTLATVQQFVAGQLRKEQQAGNISASVDVEVAAELMTRLSCSFLVTPSHVVDLDDAEQLSAVARRFLAPMLSADPNV